MKASIFLLTFVSQITMSFAQVTQQDNVVGSNLFIGSEILGEQRQVQVYTPAGYNDSEDKYPVLYILDGQLFFNHAVSLSNKFKQSKLTPDFIIVGINSSYPQRFGHYSNGKDKFIDFMAKEVIPYIEENYRTSDERLFFGWEYAGSLGFHNMMKGTIDFDAYLLASTFPIWDAIDALDSITSINTKLFFSCIGPDEYSVYHHYDKLDSVLKAKSIEGLEWSNVEFRNEEHHSTGYPTLYHGLRSYFKYYPEFQEDLHEKFVALGGVAYAKAYAKERARLYGFEPDLSSWSKFTIMRSAVRANAYKDLRMYHDEFINQDLVNDVKYRVWDVAVFHEQNSKYQKAMEIYEMLFKLFPESKDVMNKIAGAHEALGNKMEAKRYKEMAEKIGK